MQFFGTDLFDCPEHDDLPQQAGVHAVAYTGANGTRVFAWLGLPPGDGPHPALLLLHGSGHQADRSWVELWRSRGFAALAPDLEGQLVDEAMQATPDPAGMPASATALTALLDDPQQQWWYHAVHACCRGISLLQNHPGIDSRRIGCSGISRGAVLALVTAVRDRRIACLDLIYGCAFLDWQSAVDWPAEDHRQAWRRLWDPGPELAAIRCPSLWTSSPRDCHFGLDAWRRSTRSVSGPVWRSLQHDLLHGQRDGMLCIESARFAAACLAGGTPLPSLSEPGFLHGSFCCEATGTGDVLRASLLQSADTGDWRRRSWTLDEAASYGDHLHAELGPWCASAALIAHCDDGCMVSSDVVNLL